MRSLHGWDRKIYIRENRSKARGWEIDAADHERNAQATEAWTGGRHAVDDKYVELDCELAEGIRGEGDDAEGHQT